jgi:hypothetical protein
MDGKVSRGTTAQLKAIAYPTDAALLPWIYDTISRKIRSSAHYPEFGREPFHTSLHIVQCLSPIDGVFGREFIRQISKPDPVEIDVSYKRQGFIHPAVLESSTTY